MPALRGGLGCHSKPNGQVSHAMHYHTLVPLWREKLEGQKKVAILGGVFCDSAQPTLHDVVTIQELLLCRSLHPNLGWLRVKNTALQTFGRSTRVLRWTVYAARTLCCYDLVLSVGCKEVKGSDVEAEFTGFCKFSWKRIHSLMIGRSTSFIQSTCWRYQSRCPDWWDSLSPHCFPASWSFQTHSKPWRENEACFPN